MIKKRNWWDEDNFKVDINLIRNLFSETEILYRIKSTFYLYGKTKYAIPEGSILEIDSNGESFILTSYYNNITRYKADEHLLKTRPGFFELI
jgi:hypothetical protein